MKSLYISIVLFTIMLLSILFSISYLDKTCSNLNKLDTNIGKSIKNASWEKADEFSTKFLDEWEKTSKILSVFVDHKEMDNINNELWKLIQYIKCRNEDEALASTYTIKFFIDHINKMEKINIQNIF